MVVYMHDNFAFSFLNTMSLFLLPMTNLGLNVTEHQISSLHLHDHLLRPQAAFAVQPFEPGHTVLQRLCLLAIHLTGEKVLQSR